MLQVQMLKIQIVTTSLLLELLIKKLSLSSETLQISVKALSPLILDIMTMDALVRPVATNKSQYRSFSWILLALSTNQMFKKFQLMIRAYLMEFQSTNTMQTLRKRTKKHARSL